MCVYSVHWFGSKLFQWWWSVKICRKKTLVDLFTNIVFYKRHFYDWKKLFLIFAMQSIFLSFLVGFLWIPVHTSSHHAHDVWILWPCYEIVSLSWLWLNKYRERILKFLTNIHKKKLCWLYISIKKATFYFDSPL